MANDEARMTKGVTVGIRRSSFDIDSGFGFRSSDFLLVLVANLERIIKGRRRAVHAERGLQPCDQARVRRVVHDVCRLDVAGDEELIFQHVGAGAAHVGDLDAPAVAEETDGGFGAVGGLEERADDGGGGDGGAGDDAGGGVHRAEGDGLRGDGAGGGGGAGELEGAGGADAADYFGGGRGGYRERGGAGGGGH